MRSRAALLTFVLLGGAGAQGAPRNDFQVRFFGPPLDVRSVMFDGNFSVRTSAFSVQVRVPNFDADSRNASVTFSAGSFYAVGSVHADVTRSSETYTAVAGYSSASQGWLSDGAVTVVRALDSRPDVGYGVTSGTLDLRGRLSESWGWSTSVTLDEVTSNATPTEPSGTRSLTVGASGKVGDADVRLRGRLSNTTRTPGDLKFNVSIEGGVPLGATETVQGSFTYDRDALDSERVSVTSTRIEGVSVTLSAERAGGVVNGRLSATVGEDDRRSTTAEYGLVFGATPSQDAAIGVTYRESPWAVSARLAGTLGSTTTGEARATVTGSASLSYRADATTVTLRGNVRYDPASLLAWSYRADANVSTTTGPITWSLLGTLDGPSNSKPLVATATAQGLYALSSTLGVSANVRVSTGLNRPTLQFGLGVRYAF